MIFGRTCLLVMMTLIVMSACTSGDNSDNNGQVAIEEAQELVEKLESQKTEEQLNIEADEAPLDESEADAYQKALEEEQKRIEENIASSPFLEISDDKPAMMKMINERLESAKGDCKKVEDFKQFWIECQDDKIFEWLKTDKAYRNDRMQIVKDLKSEVDNCKNP